jgi:YesN/AraC family two-component response regulator
MLAKTSGTTSGGGLPFPVMKFNYDQKDILIDLGIKKGTLIAGWKIDNQKLEVSEEGETLGESIEFFVVASVYQCNHYDTQTRTTDIQTDIFFSPYDTPKMIDKKSGLTIKQLKDAKKKVTFNNILLLMVKTKEGYKPYMHFVHGTNYHQWNAQLAELGVSSDAVTLQTNFKVKTKKVPTDFQPAWVLEIQKATQRTPEEISKGIAEVSKVIKEFNAWVDSTNTGETVAAKNEAASAQDVEGTPEIDIDPENIPF